MSIIQFSNINLRFGEETIFKDFSLTIEEGEKVLITGKSGCGKSSLFQLLLGFEEIDKGNLLVNNKELAEDDFTESRQQFAYVNQDVTLRPGIAKHVLQEIAEFSGNGFDGSIDKDLAAFFEFDLKLLEKETEELSGGERQRLGLLLAIMLDRPIFLLDEITSALDQELKKKTAQYFSECSQTVLVVSHDKEWEKTSTFRKVDIK